MFVPSEQLVPKYISPELICKERIERSEAIQSFKLALRYRQAWNSFI